MISSSQHPNRHIYFDNAATSFPKPEAVTDAVIHYMSNIGGNPGRSGHPLSVEAGEIVFSARQAVADMMGVSNPMRVIFCSNATDALNLAIQGLARKGDHVITTAMEHNSTARPLYQLKQEGVITLSIVPCSSEGLIDLEELEGCVIPETRIVVINHASNVTGSVQPLRDIGSLCRDKKIILVADCAQSAGIIPINMKNDKIDLLAFAGHKGLYGPTGTGGLVIADDFDYAQLRPLRFGGTGSNSDSIEQPAFLPDRFESGTLNVAGLSGMYAGILYINEYPDGIGGIQRYKRELIHSFLERAEREIEGFVSYLPAESIQTGVVAFNIEHASPSEVAHILADEFAIMCRAGLHCAPLAHKTIGTFPEGAVRFGFSIFNTMEEISIAIEALKKIVHSRR